MATNPYSYGSLGQRWTVGEPTSKSLLDVSRVKADANRWALEQLIVDPDDTANFVLTAPGLNIDSNTLYVDSANNSVGFGLTNPNDYAFNGTPSWVASGGAGNASVIVVSGTTSIGYLAFADGTTGTDRYSGNIQYNHSTNTMSFRTNGGVEAMTINSAQDLAVDTDTLFVDASADRVGINTSSPLDALTVVGDNTSVDLSGNSALSILDGNANNEFVNLKFKTGSGGPLAYIGAKAITTGVYPNSVGQLHFAIQNGSGRFTAMVIDEDRQIGIGTNSPSAKVDIPIPSYDASTTNGMIRFTDPVNSSHANIQSYYVSGAGSGIVVGTNAYVNTSGTWSRWSTSYAGAAVHVRRTGDIKFLTNTSAGVVTERMALTSAGLLGLGTSSPSTKIHASGASSASALRLDESTSGANSYLGYLDTSGNFGIDVNGGGYLRFAVGGAERARIDSSGNLLVGTTSVYGTNKLNVNGGIAIDGRNATTPGLCEKGDVDTGIYWPTTNTIAVTTGGTERLRITSAGSLGLGTSSPTSFAGYTTLHHKNASGDVVQLAENDNGVIHQIIASGTGTVLTGSRSNHNLQIGTNDTTAITVDTSQRVGIGSSSPSQKLDVAGDVIIDNGTTSTLYFDANTNWMQLISGDFRFGLGSAEKVRILSSGGITFNGDTAAANALDDYEEGTWTPTIDGFTGTYGQNSGTYVKIGQLVHASCYITISSLTSMDGTTLDVSGFPFATENSTSVWYAGNFGNFGFLDLPTGTVQVGWNIGNGLTTSTCRAMKDNADYENVLNTAITSTSFFMYVSWTYRTA